MRHWEWVDWLIWIAGGVVTLYVIWLLASKF